MQAFARNSSGPLARGRVVGGHVSGRSGARIWRSDGTVAGTFPLTAPMGASLSFNRMSVTGGAADFDGDTTAEGTEPWKTDGTLNGTALIKDIVTGNRNSNPASFAALGSTVFFTAREDATGIELWKTDGTPAGTTMVKDIAAANQSSRPEFLTVFAGRLFFVANDDEAGERLYTSDGTPEGTRPLFTSTTSEPVCPRDLFLAGDKIYFAADAPDGTSGSETIWRTDGTQAGTVRLRTLAGGDVSEATDLVSFGGTVYFIGQEGTARELWRVVER